MTPQQVLEECLRDIRDNVFALEAYREQQIDKINEALCRANSPHCEWDDWDTLDAESMEQ